MDLIPIAAGDDRFTGLDGTYLETVRWPKFGEDGWSSVGGGRTVGVKVSGPTFLENYYSPLDGPTLDNLSAYQHRYYAVDFRPGQDSGDPDQPASHQVAELADAHTWSSELVDAEGNRTGYHTVMLDIDFPVRVLPSSTKGHYHLYIDRVVEEEKYFALLESLADAGILEGGYVEASRARAATHLRLPWVKKDSEFFSEEEDDEVSGRSGVNHAIPESLAIGIEQSKAGDVAPLPGDQQSFQDALDTLDGKLIPEAPANQSERVVLELQARAGVGQGPHHFPELQAGEISWNVDEYEVAYVDGRGVLRRKKSKSEPTHPEA